MTDEKTTPEGGKIYEKTGTAHFPFPMPQGFIGDEEVMEYLLTIDGLSGSRQMEEGAARIMQKCFDVLKTKQLAYGPMAASFTGAKGMVPRIGDKFFRLHNLLWENSVNGVPEESIRDTLQDLLNYCIITILLLDGDWPTPEGFEVTNE